MGQIGRLHIHLYFLRMKIVYLTKETFCRYNSRLFLKFRKHSSPGTFPLVIVSAAPFLCRTYGALLSSRWLWFFFHSPFFHFFFFFIQPNFHWNCSWNKLKRSAENVMYQTRTISQSYITGDERRKKKRWKYEWSAGKQIFKIIHIDTYQL